MKVACLQFAPEVGKVQDNITRADSILLDAQLPFDIDWLVLPELAFTGRKPLQSVRLEHVTCTPDCGQTDMLSLRSQPDVHTGAHIPVHSYCDSED